MSSSRSRQTSVAYSEPPKLDSNRDIEDGREYQQSQHPKSWHKTNLVLRKTSFVVGLPLLAMSVSGFVAPKGFSSFPILGTALALATIIYDVTDFIFMRARRSNRGIGPATTVGFELILSIGGFALTALLYEMTIVTLQWRGAFRGDYIEVPVPNYVINGWVWFGVSMATSILATILSIIHFVLFVRSCIEVDRNRKAKRGQEKQQLLPSSAQTQEPPTGSPATRMQTTVSDYTDYTQDTTQKFIMETNEKITLGEPSAGMNKMGPNDYGQEQKALGRLAS
ncbi:hypothetical protein F4779DRAFT_364971 [Xylariaceae sp. FL0662B]|nr:hypothetical protein F4779DRAFT_364971 [Xylariaceae sp. FL0662B]